MKILAIETSCDETAIAILEGGEEPRILANVVSSQGAVHAPWGGVVPNLAAREHLKNLPLVLQKALSQASLKLSKIDYLAVTQGPGLIPALVLGVNFAKALSYTLKRPLLGVHHIEGHLYANLLPSKEPRRLVAKANSSQSEIKKKEWLQFPVVALVVSGGHTQLILMKEHLQYQILGQTQDDAAGEAFDKVAKMLDLGYPGGPIVSNQAQEFRELLAKKDASILPEMKELTFPRPMLNKRNLDFSFSGLKTAVSYFWKKLEVRELNEVELNRWRTVICWAFEEAVVEVLTAKSLRAAQEQRVETFLLSGGVAANERLRGRLQEIFSEKASQVKILMPALRFCGDNAAMIARAAYQRIIQFQAQLQLNLKGTRPKSNPKKVAWEDNWKNLEAKANLELG